MHQQVRIKIITKLDSFFRLAAENESRNLRFTKRTFTHLKLFLQKNIANSVNRQHDEGQVLRLTSKVKKLLHQRLNSIWIDLEQD